MDGGSIEHRVPLSSPATLPAHPPRFPPAHTLPPTARQLPVTDFAGDGLHPGTALGQSILGAILEHWLQRAARQHAALGLGGEANGLRVTQHSRELPPALHPRNQRAHPRTNAPRCYHFGRPLGTGTFRCYAVLRPMPWRTAACTQLPLSSHGLGETCTRVDPQPAPSCPSFLPAEGESTAPNVWIYCSKSLPPRGSNTSAKVMSGVVAMRAGATLELPLELPAWTDDAYETAAGEERDAAVDTHAAAAHPRRGRTFSVTLDYLTSYESMGRVKIGCAGGCACPALVLDAHRPPRVAGQLVSIFEMASFTVEAAEDSHDNRHDDPPKDGGGASGTQGAAALNPLPVSDHKA